MPFLLRGDFLITNLPTTKKENLLTLKTTTMTRLKISRWQLLVALVIARRVVVAFKPEIKLATLLLMAWLGNEFLNSTADYGVCLLALVQKYRRFAVLNLFKN